MKLFSFWRSLATYRVRIALNLKGIKPDEIIDVNLMKGEQRDAKFRAVNPMMAIPALVDGDGPVLFESLAIIEYLDETHPNPPLLPRERAARARVRGLSQIVACDSHPLIVPRVREYLAHEFKVDEAGVIKWAQHWHKLALTALEQNLSSSKETGTYCHGEQITMADICVASQAAGANFFKVDLAPLSDLRAHRRELRKDRCLRARAPAQAARRAGGGMNATLANAEYRNRRPRLVGQNAGEIGARLRRAVAFRARHHARAGNGARFCRRASDRAWHLAR